MSGSEDEEAPKAAELPIAFQTFSATLRPPPRRDDKGRIVGVMAAGSPDEIWLKFIKSKHGREKHSMSEWMKLIDEYRNMPAHPAGMVN
jgi:hypothetical protein